MGLDSAKFDSRIYVVVRPPALKSQSFIEGRSQQGGWLGTVSVELDEKMVDYALFVTAHELLHTIGATDKYAPGGDTLFPIGLAEPNRDPLYPQSFTEVMARSRPLGDSKEALPDSFIDLRVGRTTAREVGWIR